MQITKIISGGQTGADRAALDWAQNNGIAYGGWCPKGRRAEDGVIPYSYGLKETGVDAYAVRTEWNVREGDATVLFSIEKRLSGGTRLTADLADRHGIPWIHITPCSHRSVRQALGGFLEAHPVFSLNVAGPRASHEPAVGTFVHQCLDTVVDFFCGEAPSLPWRRRGDGRRVA